ncbi:YkvA family protein [Clostridium aestuarii]|uniref:YkvA family protein n=1 Tax=Clostridium aestuarii TaxID=338193 RepID=A0ABT4CZY7_9CLOT|nr:YkvA family protein [Clostridium aestuarii]MCY6484543.1 YkvA family protein [Clostridium aestuarii]
MNISGIKVRLNEKDLLGMIKENVQVEGLNIEEISIKELFRIKGSFTKGVKIYFEISLGLGKIENNILKLKIFSLKLGKIPIWTKFVNFALKRGIKGFENKGISISKGTIFLDLTLMCKYIPAVDFTLRHITILNGEIQVDVKNLMYSESKEALSFDEFKDKIKTNEEIEKNEKIVGIKKTKDSYSEIRKSEENKIPEKYKNINEVFMIIPDITVLLYRLMKDDRVDKKTKILIGAAVGYLVIPLDIIPDFIPVLGKIDDVGIAFLVLDKIISNIPEDIIREHWQGDEDIIAKVKEINELLFSILGRKNTLSILSGTFIFAKKVMSKKKLKSGGKSWRKRFML